MQYSLIKLLGALPQGSIQTMQHGICYILERLLYCMLRFLPPTKFREFQEAFSRTTISKESVESINSFRNKRMVIPQFLILSSNLTPTKAMGLD